MLERIPHKVTGLGPVRLRMADLALSRQASFCLRRDMPLQLMALQLTNYHSLSDRHGQRLMRRMQTRLTQAIDNLKRAEDWQCAWGEGHMVFCLPDTPARGARQLARRLLKQLADHRFVYQGASLKFELRAGLHTLCLESSKAPDYRKQIMRTVHTAHHGAGPISLSPQFRQALATSQPAAAGNITPSQQIRLLVERLDEPARARLADELLLTSTHLDQNPSSTTLPRA